jgi:uncharacterized protein (DUF1015 family)
MNILPFSGYRYNVEQIQNLDDVICPPYDQFKEGLDELLYQRHHYNFARLVVNKETPQDTVENNRYTRSRTLLEEWIRQRVFLRDTEPGVYPYFQDYRVGEEEKRRKGFIALGEVTEYSQKVVLPHERTLSKPKQDRLSLLRATLADTGLVFMLYSDPSAEIERILDEHTYRPPLMRALDLNQEENLLWRLKDPGVIEKIQEIISGKSVIIADGHHRYEVARLFSQEITPKICEDPRWGLYRYKLMSFIRLESEGITIFPIHRLLHSLNSFEAGALLQRMTDYFVVEEYPFDTSDKFTILDFLIESSKKQQQAGANAFVLYLPSLKRFALTKLRREAASGLDWPPDKSLTWRKLDVSVLHVVILGRLLGIGETQLSDQANLEYVSHHTDAVRITDLKNYQCAFLLNPTPIEHLKGVVEAGDLLPQKSTHFHPKLMEGLVFAKHL